MRTAYNLLLPVALILFLWGFGAVVMTPVEAGDAYPRYSTLRPDAMGAKALYESFAGVPGLTVERNFRTLETLPLNSPPTIFILGGSAADWYHTPEQIVERWEAMANAGARLVFVFEPAIPGLKGNFEIFESNAGKDKQKPPPTPPVLRHLKVAVKLRQVPASERATYSRSPKDSAVYFTADPTWRTIEAAQDGYAMQKEKTFGRGSIVVATQMFRLSNQGLREAANPAWISQLAGPNARLVFDEYHHHVQDTGSIGSLIRRYSLQGAVLVLIVIGLLFIWRNATSLLPPRAASNTASEPLTGWNAQHGLATLFERSIPRDRLVGTCLDEWNKSASQRPAISDARRKAAQEAARQHPDSPVDAYRGIHKVLTETK